MKLITSEALLPWQHTDRATNTKQGTITDDWKRSVFREQHCPAWRFPIWNHHSHSSSKNSSQNQISFLLASPVHSLQQMHCNLGTASLKLFPWGIHCPVLDACRGWGELPGSSTCKYSPANRQVWYGEHPSFICPLSSPVLSVDPTPDQGVSDKKWIWHRLQVWTLRGTLGTQGGSVAAWHDNHPGAKAV